MLQTRGQYQMKPPLPFVPGSGSPGMVRMLPDGRQLRRSNRVASLLRAQRLRRIAVAPAFLTFALRAALDFAQGASLILNYHTAYFALELRGRLKTD